MMWNDFLKRNQDQLAGDLEQVAEVLRNGSTSDLAEFLSRDISARAEEAAKKARA